VNEVVLCEEKSWLPIPGLLTVLLIYVIVGLRAFLMVGLRAFLMVGLWAFLL